MDANPTSKRSGCQFSDSLIMENTARAVRSMTDEERSAPSPPRFHVNSTYELGERRHQENFERCRLAVDRDQRYNWSEIYKQASCYRWLYDLATSYPELWATCPAEILEAVATKIAKCAGEPEGVRPVNPSHREGILLFMKSCYHDAPGICLTLKSVYSTYVSWCTSQRIVGMADSVFSRTLRAVYRTHPYIMISNKSHDNYIVGFEKNDVPKS